MPKTPPAEVSLMTRFWLRTAFVDPRSDDCMTWMGTTLPTGYGQLTGPDGQVLYAHRVGYALIHGPIPDGMVVRHLCHNPSCVRPSHLEIGTQSDNANDKVAAGRTRVIDPANDHEVSAIRHLIASGRWSQGDAARLILGDGAAQPTVNRMVTGKSRKSAPGPITRKGRGVPPRRRPHLEKC